MRLFAEQRGRGDAIFRRHDAHEDRRDLGADDVVIRLEGAVCIGAVDDAGAVEFVDGLLGLRLRAGPKDGAQLRLMLENLETQDKALTQLFTGIITKDTTEHIFTIIPEKDFSKQILFRLSQKLGIVDSDDLAGAPYYIDIKDLNILPAKEPVPANKKVEKNGVFVNVPGKIRMST